MPPLVIQASDIVQGMTNANMKMVVLDVPFSAEQGMPEPKLDPGEFIKARIVELGKLRNELRGTWHSRRRDWKL